MKTNLIDIFTYNKRIKKVLEKILGIKACLDESLPETLYCFLDVPSERIEYSKIDFLVEKRREADIKGSGGYEVKDSETGICVRCKRSYVEQVARIDF